ncbi:MAG: endonuclease [Chitinophagales bacterium]|nr:endonuclease [Chitinophagales bacterium]
MIRIFFSVLAFSFVSIVKGQMPTQQVTEAKITDTFAWKVNLSFKVPTTSDSAILIISTSPLSSLTLTNKFYGVGSHITPGIKVHRKFYKGSNTIEHSIKGLLANTTYYLAFYTFNNNMNGIFYNQTNPPRLSFKTKGRNIASYYSSLDTNKATFLSKLTTLLRNHNFSSTWYTEYTKVVDEVYVQDTFVNDSTKKYITCSYSNIKAIYNPNTAPSAVFPVTGFNREHTLPKNWMNFRGIPNNDLVDYAEGADWHNLTLTDGKVNEQRSDFVFKIPLSPSSMGNARFFENKSKYSDTNNCFEPQNSYKGDAARCIFYMQTCYHKLLDSSWSLKNGLRSFAKNQSDALLVQWAKNDPPDNQEIARHEYIASVQGSRNPFIDFPDWIECINFKDLSILKTCQGLEFKNSINSPSNSSWDVWYYKIVEGKYAIKLYHDKISTLNIYIYDLNGKLVKQENTLINEGENALPLELHGISKGQYILNIKSTERNKSFRLLLD